MKTATKKQTGQQESLLLAHVTITPKTHAKLRKWCEKRGLKMGRAADLLVRRGMRGAL